MKIADFISSLSGGIAKPNRYTILLRPPFEVMGSILSGGNTSLQKILMYCDSTQLPGVNLNTNQVRTFGEVREMPYEINYEPITLSFYVDVGMNVKKLFDNWIMYTNIRETRKFRYYNEYVTDMSIFVQDNAEKTRYEVKFYEVYPKTVSAITMDYAAKDLMKMQVTLMFKYWRSYQVDNSAAAESIFAPENSYSSTTSVQDYLKDFTSFQTNFNAEYSLTPEAVLNETGNVVANF